MGFTGSGENSRHCMQSRVLQGFVGLGIVFLIFFAGIGIYSLVKDRLPDSSVREVAVTSEKELTDRAIETIRPLLTKIVKDAHEQGIKDAEKDSSALTKEMLELAEKIRKEFKPETK